MKKTLLSLSLITLSFLGKAQNCSELFISEYAEGSGNNKGIEFYNPTNASINLSNYRLVRYSNGSATGSDSTDLVGTIGSYSTFVLVNGQTSGPATSPACNPAMQALAQQLDHAYPAPTYVNGDDAMALVKKVPYALIDIFGEIGVQPTTAWSDQPPYDGTAGKWWTKDHSLQRKSSVMQGVASNPAPFNVTLEWDSLPKDNWSKLGTHLCNCNTVGIKEQTKHVNFNVFPNPSNGNDLSLVSDKNITSVKISNTIGQVIYSQATITNQTKITLNDLNLTKGIYFVTIVNEVGTKTQKITIQ